MLCDVLHIPFGRKAQSTIKKLVEHAQQFQLSVNVDHTVQQSPSLKKTPKMFIGGDDRPAQIWQRNTLRGPPGTDLAIAVLDVGLGLVEQPIAQMKEYLSGAIAKFVGRDFVEFCGSGRCTELADEAGDQFVTMSFN